jgi:hypothetical protein
VKQSKKPLAAVTAYMVASQPRAPAETLSRVGFGQPTVPGPVYR